MGVTAVSLIYSPWGRRSGAHMNPAVTLTFLRLGKVAPRDAFGYIAAQLLGGSAGIVAATVMLGGLPSDSSVNYVATLPGAGGWIVAFAGELGISFALMTVVLGLSNVPRTAGFTGVAAGTLVAMCIIVESPLSGTSMNPARTLGSNVLADAAGSLWLYFTAPPLGMLLAAELFIRRHGLSWIRCAKLHHTSAARCIFRCGHTSVQTEIAS